MHQNPFSAGDPPDPAGGAYDAPQDPLVGWVGGYPLSILLPARRLRRLELGAGASVLRIPSTQNPGYASATHDPYPLPLGKASRYRRDFVQGLESARDNRSSDHQQWLEFVGEPVSKKGL